jgi:acyl phosphate:glycerol-3-phosphate acyltransferase
MLRSCLKDIYTLHAQKPKSFSIILSAGVQISPMTLEQPTEFMPFLPLLAFVISYGTGYLLGSIPFGLILTRLTGLGDIRQIGSGNIGATNVLRTGRKGLAALTLLLDAAKGAVAVIIGQQYTPVLGMVAGAAALLGHSYPVWLKYKGGKGVATAFGLSLALSPALGAAMGFTWLMVALLVRYSSLAAISVAVLAPIYAWFLADKSLAVFYVVIGGFVIWRHRANIKRLIDGTETQIELRRSSSKTDAT